MQLFLGLPAGPFSAGGTVAGPLGLFGTTLHEIGHAAAALLFGIDVDGMVVRSDGSGSTFVSAQSIGDTASFAISSFGYLGVLFWAGVFLLAGRWARASQIAFFVVGALLVLSALLWMDGAFAFGTAVVLGGACVVIGALVPERLVGTIATVLGAVLAFSGLSDVASVREGNVDGFLATQAIGLGLPTLRILWLLVGIAMVGGGIAARALIGRDQLPPTTTEPTGDGFPP